MINRKSNIVLPKIGAKEASVSATIAKYKAAGYEVRLIYMDVSPENAYTRMVTQFVNIGRLIPPAYLDRVGAKPSAVFRLVKSKGLADGYAEINNNGGFTDAKQITQTSGVNALEGASFGESAGAGGRNGGANAPPEPRNAGPVTENSGRAREGPSGKDPIDPILDQVPTGNDEDVVAPFFKSRAEVAAELDKLDEFVSQVEVCLKGQDNVCRCNSSRCRA